MEFAKMYAFTVCQICREVKKKSLSGQYISNILTYIFCCFIKIFIEQGFELKLHSFEVKVSMNREKLFGCSDLIHHLIYSRKQDC